MDTVVVKVVGRQERDRAEYIHVLKYRSPLPYMKQKRPCVSEFAEICHWEHRRSLFVFSSALKMLLRFRLPCRLLQTSRLIIRPLPHTQNLCAITTKRCLATARKATPKAQPSALPKQPPPKAFQPSNSKAAHPAPPTPSPKLFTGSPKTPLLATPEVGKGEATLSQNPYGSRTQR